MSIRLQLCSFEMDADRTRRMVAVKKPSEVFTHCPHCKSQNILKIDEEVFCNNCRWDSLYVHAELEAEFELEREARIVEQRRERQQQTKIARTRRPKKSSGPSEAA